MSIIIKLQGLPFTAKASDIRDFFNDMKIPKGAVNIVGGLNGEAFIGFTTDEDARLAMGLDGGLLHDSKIKLYLSSKREMEAVISNAHSQALAAKSSFPSGLAFQIPPALSQVINSTSTSAPLPKVENSTSQKRAVGETSGQFDAAANKAATEDNWKQHADYKAVGDSWPQEDAQHAILPVSAASHGISSGISGQSFPGIGSHLKPTPLQQPLQGQQSVQQQIYNSHSGSLSFPQVKPVQSFIVPQPFEGIQNPHQTKVFNGNKLRNDRFNQNDKYGVSYSQDGFKDGHDSTNKYASGDNDRRKDRNFNKRDYRRGSDDREPKRKRSRSPLNSHAPSDSNQKTFFPSQQSHSESSRVVGNAGRCCVLICNVPFKATFADVKNFILSAKKDCASLSRITRVYPDIDKSNSDKWVAEFADERDANAVIKHQGEVQDRKIRAMFIDPRRADDLIANLEQPENVVVRGPPSLSNQPVNVIQPFAGPQSQSEVWRQTGLGEIKPLISNDHPKMAVLQASTEEELITRGELPPQSFGAFSAPSFNTQGFLKKSKPPAPGVHSTNVPQQTRPFFQQAVPLSSVSSNFMRPPRPHNGSTGQFRQNRQFHQPNHGYNRRGSNDVSPQGSWKRRQQDDEKSTFRERKISSRKSHDSDR